MRNIVRFRFNILIIIVLWCSLDAIENNISSELASVEGDLITYENLTSSKSAHYSINDFNNIEKVTEVLRKKIEVMIRNIIYKEYLTDLTDEIIDNEWKRYYPADKKVYIDALEKQKEKVRTLLKALDLVYDQNMNKDDVYNQIYNNKQISKEIWLGLLDNYKTIEKREILKKQLSVSFDDYFNKPDEGFIIYLKGVMIDKIIDDEMINKSPTYEEFYQMKTKDAGDSVVIHQGEAMKRYYLQYKRNIWWRNKANEMKIEIKDEKYKKVLDMLFEN